MQQNHLIRLPAFVPVTSLPDLWIDDLDSVVVEHGWAMVTVKTAPLGGRPWFALDRAELARVLFPLLKGEHAT